MNERLENLICQFNKVTNELQSIPLDTFVLNPRIEELTSELMELQEEIELLKGDSENGE